MTGEEAKRLRGGDHLDLMVPDRPICIRCNGEGRVSVPTYIDRQVVGEMFTRRILAGSDSSKCPDCDGTGRDLPSPPYRDF